MSVLLAVVSTVVATPTPVVVKEVITNNQVPVTPPEVLQLAQLLAVAAAGAVTSLVHQVVERGRWNSNFNRVVLAAYSTAAALITAWLTGHLGWNVADATVMVAAFFTALGSASGRYELYKFVTGLSATADPVVPAVVDPTVPAV